MDKYFTIMFSAFLWVMCISVGPEMKIRFNGLLMQKCNFHINGNKT